MTIKDIAKLADVSVSTV
ncbi:MAG: LacI family DNA-binding transcriptional regulator, partial [Oscillospiraceae bacterium]|nr:LacI family DNA-binding transcriptional regulator [Oscillospiraceae bacterium]